MEAPRIFDTTTELAHAAAEQTIALLEAAIAKHGTAVWVLAGGSTPMLAYEAIARDYIDEIDWSKVMILIGDERIGPLNGKDNNWHQINKILLNKISARKIRPESNLRAVDTAKHYEKMLDELPQTTTGMPRFDVLWLGVGPDGHTLSLFPGHDSITPTKRLVIPVHNSPKPPSDRVSLSLRALTGTKTALILVGGSEKQDAITKALSGGHLPIALAAHIITAHRGHVRWLLDKSVAPSD